VIVAGTPRPLRPMVSDEVYRIGHERRQMNSATRNASDIEVELD